MTADEPQLSLGLDDRRAVASGEAFAAERLTEQPIVRRTQDSLWGEERAPYRRMTMDQIRAVPWNGLTAVSSFSGCGGSSLGLRMAGWRVPYAIEFIPAAADTYEANSDAFVDRRDVREIRGLEIMDRLGIERGELDLFEGSPPCSSFSNAGSRESGWGKVKKYSDGAQRTDDLFDEYVRLIDELRPRAFLAENVPGLLAGSAMDAHAAPIFSGLRALGYRVDAKVLNAAAYGVPQARRRLIIIGYREDQGLRPTFPASTQTVPFTLREALADVTDDDPADVAASSLEGFSIAWSWKWAKGLMEKDVCVRCGVKLLEHEQRVVEAKIRTKKVAGLQRERTRYYCADGQKAQEIRNYFMFSMPELDLPCPTLTAAGKDLHVDSVVHPEECRKLTPAEARSVCGFPADFALTGTRAQRYERMGRAVMPPLYQAVGWHIAEALSSAG